MLSLVLFASEQLDSTLFLPPISYALLFQDSYDSNWADFPDLLNPSSALWIKYINLLSAVHSGKSFSSTFCFVPFLFYTNML